MIESVDDFQQPFFMGIAGSGMSAIAQYLKGVGKQVSGSDRLFIEGEHNEVRTKLEADGIPCFVQDGSGIRKDTDLVVISTAVEDTVPEMQRARELNIPIIKRSALLSIIAASKKTIAVAGTSGKSTTSAMLFDILEHAGIQPSIISGAGLVSIIREGKIGNAKVGSGDWLVIEADESDGSIIEYKPEIGLLLNIDKDHQEIRELMELFITFRDNSRHFIVNQSHPLARRLSRNEKHDFTLDPAFPAGYTATSFHSEGLQIGFRVNNTSFSMNVLGKHNMENAMAAIAVAGLLGIDPQICAEALRNYEGIYRRHQVYGKKKGVWLIDDYAHNPVKCAAAIEACQPVATKLIAWFQPHGYKPTKFLREEFVHEIAKALRPQDEIWMSEIYYAGGTAVKDISANDLIGDLRAMGKQAFFAENRDDFLEMARPHFTNDTVVLLMAARDPSLEDFAKQTWKDL